MAEAAHAPGFEKHPHYSIRFEPIDANVEVWVDDDRIALTKAAISLLEGKYPPVVYVPFADVDPAKITATDSQTYCPFKGHASYWTIDAGGKTLTDTMWGYLAPYVECEAIDGYCAFYADRVNIRLDGVAQ